MPPDRWFVISVRAPSEELIGELAEGLVALGGTAVEEELRVLTTYIPPPDDPEAFARDACERLRALVPGHELELSWRWRANEDWARDWRRGLGPRRIGRRLVVTPSWVDPTARPDEIVLVIDPKMAFGTGEHATTRGVLRLLEGAVRRDDRVLDVGTGTGVLSIAAVRLGAARVLAVEVDDAALENAAENVERNGVADRVRLRHGLVDAPFLDALGPQSVDLILANVLSTVLVPLLPAFHDALAGTGRLILGGILADEAGSVVSAAEGVGLALRYEDRELEWWTACFERAGG